MLANVKEAKEKLTIAASKMLILDAAMVKPAAAGLQKMRKLKQKSIGAKVLPHLPWLRATARWSRF